MKFYKVFTKKTAFYCIVHNIKTGFEKKILMWNSFVFFFLVVNARLL